MQRRNANTSPSKTTNDANKISVVASTFPLSEFVEVVGGEFIDLTVIIPPGIEPHEFEPTPSVIAHAENADVVFFQGGGYDVWSTDIITNLEEQHVRSMTLFDEVSRETPNVIRITNEKTDPHVWMNPEIVVTEIKSIRDTLSDIDSSHAAIYRDHAANYINELQQLTRDIDRALHECSLRSIMVSHNAYGYFGDRFNVNILSIHGPSPETEPSLQDRVTLVTQVQHLGIHTVFNEPLSPDPLAEDIAHELQVSIDVLDPLEGYTTEAKVRDDNYFSVMHRNVNALVEAMNCVVPI